MCNAVMLCNEPSTRKLVLKEEHQSSNRGRVRPGDAPSYAAVSSDLQSFNITQVDEGGREKRSQASTCWSDLKRKIL
jgi:hypothetical protein